MSWDTKVQNLLGHCTRDSAFGADVIHVPTIGDPQTFKGIWSETYISAEPDGGLAVMSNDPNVAARLSDFDVSPVKNDQIDRNGIFYYVRVIEPDGEGGVLLVLEKVKIV